MAKLTRINRLVRLIGLLQGGRARNAKELARECGVNRRTIFRDINVLKEVGVPLVYRDDAGGYCIPGTYYLPPTNFTTDEALAVMILCHELGQNTGLPFYEAARKAATKLENSLPPGLRDYLRVLSDAISIELGATAQNRDHKSVYEALVQAIADRRAVRIRYGSLYEGEEIQTKLSPYRLLFNRHSWYVIGRSSLHRSTRTFKVDRVHELTSLTDDYSIPKHFNLRRYLRNAWSLIPEAGPDRRVTIRFSPRVAQNVAEVMWHRTQKTKRLEDGSLEFRVTVSGIHEIAWWILGYGAEAEVLQPKELRAKLADSARAMLEVYK